MGQFEILYSMKKNKWYSALELLTVVQNKGMVASSNSVRVALNRLRKFGFVEKKNDNRVSTGLAYVYRRVM